MKAYKGFNKDMTCRGFQYEVGKEYETDKAELCKCGFHACLYPQDCYGYYPPANSRYCLVELDDVVESKDHKDTKVCGKKIKIVKELTIEEMTTASVEYVLDLTEKEEKNTGNRGAASATGDWGAASATGNRGAASATGDLGAASATGDHSVALAAGYKCKAKARLGSAICVVERGAWNGKTYPLLAIKAAIVDGEKIKANTWYKLENGEFVEVNENE